MMRDQLAELPVFDEVDSFADELLFADDAADQLAISEHQLYLLMHLDKLVPVARYCIVGTPWSQGKLLWSRNGIAGFAASHKRVFDECPDRMYIGPVAHLIADHPDDGPGPPTAPSTTVELDWPRPFCASQYNAESWRGRPGRFWEMEKCYTMRLCKKCEAALLAGTRPAPRAKVPYVPGMYRTNGLDWLIEYLDTAIAADRRWTEDSLVTRRTVVVALQSLGVSVTEIREAINRVGTEQAVSGFR